MESFRSELHRLVVPVNTKGKEKLITLQGTSCTANWSGQEVRVRSLGLLEEKVYIEQLFGNVQANLSIENKFDARDIANHKLWFSELELIICMKVPFNA